MLTVTAAKAIREELKATFPKQKFSVRKDGYSAVNISWIDGPAEDQVGALVFKYKMGNFDGMIDSYEYSNRRDDIPQVHYIFTRRELSDAVKLSAWEKIKDHFGLEGSMDDFYQNLGMYGTQLIRRVLAEGGFLGMKI